MTIYHDETDSATASAFEGYGEWSEEIERQAWAGAEAVETPNGQVLIKPECNRTGLHRDCTIYRCMRANREGGFDL